MIDLRNDDSHAKKKTKKNAGAFRPPDGEQRSKRKGDFIKSVSYKVYSNKRIKHSFPCTRGVFYVRREVDLKKTAKVNAYIMHIFGKIEPLFIHAT